MSAQWGHGYHSGKADGVDVGVEIGKQVGAMEAAEQAFHCTTSAIAALKDGHDVRALAVLRSLQLCLAINTGRIQVTDSLRDGGAA